MSGSPLRRARPASVWAVVAVALLTACAKTTPRAEPTPTPSAPPTPTPTPVVRAPLTGLPVEPDADFLERSALAVKIENSRPARPQTGLDKADIVYEELVEGGETRFIAIFHSRAADPLGPVRSARPEDPDILREYRALLAYSGAAFYVKRLIRATPGIGSLRQGEAGEAYYRVRERRQPHNLYTSTKALYRAGREYDLPPARAFFKYSRAVPGVRPGPSSAPGGATPEPSVTASGSPAAPATLDPNRPLSGRRLVVDFSSPPHEVMWRFTASNGTYRRSQAGERHVMASGKQLRAKNVLVMFVDIKSAGELDPTHHSTPISIMTGSGKALLLRDGYRIRARWSRPSLSARTKFETTEGKVLRLAPGTTWVELVPVGREVRAG